MLIFYKYMNMYLRQDAVTNLIWSRLTPTAIENEFGVLIFILTQTKNWLKSELGLSITFELSYKRNYMLNKLRFRKKPVLESTLKHIK